MRVDFGLELAPLDSTEVEKIRAWRNNYAVWRWCRQSDVISDVEQQAWFERQSKDPTVKMYAVQTRVEGKRETVGVCGLTSIDWLNRRAEFSLYTAPEHHRKGFGREALKLLLLHGFANLGLEQIWGETFEGNHAAKMFEAIGFKKDGTRRRFYFKDGAFHDAHLYSILRDEWQTTLQSSSASSSPSLPSPSDQGALSSPGRSSAGRGKRGLRRVPKPLFEEANQPASESQPS